MASAKGTQMAVKVDTSADAAGGSSTAVQKKRGRPKGSKNNATLKAEAEAAARGRNLRLRGSQGMVAGLAAPKEEPSEHPAMAAAGGSHPLPPPLVELVPGMSVKIGPKFYRIGRFGDLPVHEFIVYAGWSGLTRTSLPEPLKPVFDKSLQGSATVREASPKQRLWRVVVERDGDGHAVLAGAWEDFVRWYDIRPHSSLMFRLREGTSNFVVKVFNNGCRVRYPPDEEE